MQQINRILSLVFRPNTGGLFDAQIPRAVIRHQHQSNAAATV